MTEKELQAIDARAKQLPVYSTDRALVAKSYYCDVPRLVAEVRRLRGLLAPFASVADKYVHGLPDSYIVYPVDGITLGHCRAAREATK